MALRNWDKPSCPLKSLNDGSSNYWTASSGGTNEYYYNQTDVDEEPFTVTEDSVAMTKATVGSLDAGEWSWGDNDSIGENRIYVRLSDNVDPDTKASGFIKCSELITAMQVDSGKTAILLSMIISNFGSDATIDVIFSDSGDTEKIRWRVELSEGNSPFVIDSKMVFANQDKIKIHSSSADVAMFLSGDET